MFALGIVVFVHELGHFLVARWCGIKVLRFSIGFGPKICSWKRGETEYCVSWLFFGGYVKFLGDELDNETAHKTEGAYYSVSPWKRIWTCLAGPGMNLLFAFVMYCMIFVMGRPVLVDEKVTIIGSIVKDSPAQSAGLMPGDQIIRMDNHAISSWKEVLNTIALSSNDKLHMGVLRDGQNLDIEVTPQMDAKRGVRMIGISRKETIKVGEIDPGMPAEKAGLQKGDIIIGFEGQKIYQWNELMGAVQTHGDKEAILLVNRQGNNLELAITPQKSQDEKELSMGFTSEMDFVTEHPNPFTEMKNDIQNIFQTLSALFARTVSPKGLSGPVGILVIIGMFAKAGLVYFLGLMALISVNLGVFNVLPIPVLDGGHVLFNLIEIIFRRPLPKKALIIIQNIFVTILIGFILFVTYQDIARLITKFFGK